VRPVYLNDAIEEIACTLIDNTELHEAEKELKKLKKKGMTAKNPPNRALRKKAEAQIKNLPLST
jgi:hypothetical protein